MIPRRLQLQNFMSYGERVPPLDLTGVRLACLCGDNGHGKSALLDAMTWALFGETRARTEDDLIRLGAKDCAVLLDFQVGETLYRVHRRRDRRGGALWELQAWQEDGATRSLTGATSRETRAKIESLLRMDYKTFVATAYLAQGQSDLFARATPGDRKKILADILDLSRYERLEQLAREKMKEAEARETDADRTLRAIDEELEEEDRIAAELEAARQTREAAQAQTAEREAALQEALRHLEQMEAEAQTAREREDQIREAEEEIATAEREAAAIQQRIDDAEQVLARRDQILAAHQILTRLTQRLRPLEDQYHAGMTLQNERRELEETIRQEAETLERERYRLERDIEQREQETRDQEKYDGEIATLDAEIAAYTDPEARRAEAEEARRQAEEALGQLRAEYATARAAQERLERRIEALESSEAPVCDYCGQPLSPEARREAAERTRTERAETAAALETQAALGRDAKRAVEERQREADQAVNDLQAVSRLAARRAQIEQERLRLEARIQELPARRERIEALTQRLETRDYAQSAQERLMRVSARTEKLERIGQEIQQLRAERDRLADAERERLLLLQAEETARTEPPRLAELQTRIERRFGQIEKAQLQIAQIRARTAGLAALRQVREEATLALAQARAEAQTAERQIGQLTAWQERLTKRRTERARWEEERRDAIREKELHRELVAAFGKKGVQALIIENALPEIEEEANRLLARMTGGAMSVRLRTQREAKAKAASAIETLDIILADDLGTRPYEMYSGGEAFRVNLALRVALSKMLAHRAGAPLQTLILDEGFGTQDPRGREAITDALHTVSEEFEVVLVITHIDELKEQFPTRIEVVKGPDGSSFTVV